MKNVQQLIENELQNVVQQLASNSLTKEAQQELIQYKNELQQLLFLKKLSNTYHLESKKIEKVITLPTPSMTFADFRIVDDTETEERTFWQELKIEGEKLFLNEGDIVIKKK